MKVTAVLMIILATWVQLWAQTKRCDRGASLRKLAAPTGCDIRQVQAAYKQLKLNTNHAPLAKKIGKEEGEEPVHDDTPIVVPNP